MREEKTKTPIERLFEIATALNGARGRERVCELRVRVDYPSFRGGDEPSFSASLKRGDSEAWTNASSPGSSPEKAIENLSKLAEDRLQYEIEEHAKQAATLTDVARSVRYGR